MELSRRLRETPMNSSLKFIGRLFELRDAAHVEHLKTRSFAAHSALNTLYDDLLDLADGFVESYQGKYGIVAIDIKHTNKTPVSSTKIYFFNIKINVCKEDDKSKD